MSLKETVMNSMRYFGIVNLSINDAVMCNFYVKYGVLFERSTFKFVMNDVPKVLYIRFALNDYLFKVVNNAYVYIMFVKMRLTPQAKEPFVQMCIDYFVKDFERTNQIALGLLESDFRGHIGRYLK